MRIGVPKEIKDREFRVGLTPGSVRVLVENDHQVFLERGAGAGSGFSDGDYRRVGAEIVSCQQAWSQQLIVKVKEPLAEEYQYLRPDLILFAYLHLAADRNLTEQLLKTGTVAIAYETVQLPDGRLPLLNPMSVIAGRLAVQFGARFLERQQGGRGVLLGGVPGVRPGNVVILGGGTVGTEAAKVAAGMGARVQILDIDVDRLTYLETIFGSRVELLYSSSEQLELLLPQADLVIGAVLVAGKKAPVLVSRSLVSQMRPGSAIVDVAVDQGGCLETSRPTSHTNPTYEVGGVIHAGIPNLPGAVPWTATQALNNSTLPYILKLADGGLLALERDPALARGVNVRDHQLIHPALKQEFAPDFKNYER